MILLLSLLVTGCRPSADDSGSGPILDEAAYEAGWAEGCTLGKADGRTCQAADVSVLELRGDDYAAGISDGYAECHAAWYALQGC